MTTITESDKLNLSTTQAKKSEITQGKAEQYRMEQFISFTVHPVHFLLSLAVELSSSDSRITEKEHEFFKKAVEYLVHNVGMELHALVKAITTRGKSGDCATIPRPKYDGRIHVGKRKVFPHVLAAKLWRWSDLDYNGKSELQHLTDCNFPFHLKQHDFVCVNPFHVKRVDSPGRKLESRVDSPGETVAKQQMVDLQNKNKKLEQKVDVLRNRINKRDAENRWLKQQRVTSGNESKSFGPVGDCTDCQTLTDSTSDITLTDTHTEVVPTISLVNRLKEQLRDAKEESAVKGQEVRHLRRKGSSIN